MNLALQHHTFTKHYGQQLENRKKQMSKFKYKVGDTTFKWQGGAYIEIFNFNETTPWNVFNVWDYEKDEPTIERSLVGLISYVDERIEELSQI
jgi:hypothetical protein